MGFFFGFSFFKKFVFHACFIMLIRSLKGGKNLGTEIFQSRNMFGLEETNNTFFKASGKISKHSMKTSI